MLKEINEITYFQLTKKQIILLIVSSNVLHLIACAIGNNGLMLNLLSVFLVVLVSVYLIVLLNVLEKSNSLDDSSSDKEKNIIKSLRNEYRKILQQKKRKRLFNKECSSDIALEKDSGFKHTVQLDYLNKITSDDSHV